jgi:anti-anti-sigma factor
LIPERDEQPLAAGERVNGHSSGGLLSRIASDDGVILAVVGELDIASAQEFGEGVRAMTEGEKGEVVLSLQDCGFIDSSGLRALIMLARELRSRGQTLVLSGLNGGPRRVFEITGLLDGADFEVRDAVPSGSAG